MEEAAVESVPETAPLDPSTRNVERGAANARQNALKAEVRSLVGAEEFSACAKLRLSYTLWDTTVIYLMLGSVVIGMCWLHGAVGPWALLATPLFAFVSGVAFNWVNVQIHEASHYLLLSKRYNDLYCNLAVGALGLQDVETYRATHMMHHGYLHTERDPDLWVYTQNVGSFRQFLRGVLDDLSLRTISRRKRQVTEFMRATGLRQGAVPRYVPFAKLFAQCFVLGTFVWSCGIYGVLYYVAAYLYGLLAVFPVLVRARTVVQHFDAALLAPSDEGSRPFISRSTIAPFIEFLVVGARMDYHFEHHLYPNMPHYGLAKMHRTLTSRGFFHAASAGPGQGLHTDDYVKTYLRLSIKGA
jgi:fatty acid desaturase